MDNSKLLQFVKQAARAVPGVVVHLSPSARRAVCEPTPYKTFEFFLSAVEGLVRGVYLGLVDSDFVYAMDNLIFGQLRDAYTRAWVDDGNFGELPDYLQESLDAMVEEQQSYVVDFFRAIIDARVYQTPIAPLINRAGLWANQYNTAYGEAVRLIALENGGKLIWREGDTVQKCETCVALDGIVMYAKEWETLGVHPQGFPNDKLECKGGHCDCSLLPTDERRSPKGFETVMNIITLSAGKTYDPNQPRVPAGNSDDGQWTSFGGEGSILSNDGDVVGGVTMRDGITRFEEIKELQKYAKDKYAGEYDYIGIRVQDGVYGASVGQTYDYESNIWIDGENTGESVGGVSAISTMGMVDRGSNYIGDTILILGSNSAFSGEDAGEIVMKKPNVLEIIQR